MGTVNRLLGAVLSIWQKVWGADSPRYLNVACSTGAIGALRLKPRHPRVLCCSRTQQIPG